MQLKHLLPGILAIGIGSTHAEEIDYERDIAPILRAYCAGCHNDVDLEGDLSVETYAQLVEGASKKTVRAGEPDNSYLIKVMDGRSKPKMPPEDEPSPTDRELELLKRWIAEGAKPPKEDTSLLAKLVVPEVAASKKPRPITALAVSPDGSIQAKAMFGEIVLTGKIDRKLTGLPGKVTSLQFSNDGAHLVAASGITGLSGVAKLWDLKAPNASPLKIQAGRDLLYDAVISPDGLLIATAGYDRAIRIWNSKDGSLGREIDGHKGAVFDLAFHPEGKVIASASADGTAKLWRVKDGIRLDTLTGTAGEQYSIEFTPNGKHLLAAGADNRIRMWRMLDFDQPRIQPLVHARFAHEGAIERIAITPDGKTLISSADDRSLKSWTLPSLVLNQTLTSQPDSVTSIVPGNDSSSFAVSLMNGTSTSYELKDVKVGDPGNSSEPTEPKQEPTDPPALVQGEEKEPNNTPEAANKIATDGEIAGNISSMEDTDLFRFSVTAGEKLIFEINAARSKSKLDSKIEILHLDGSPVEQVVLQAVRDSWFTFRGKDSSTSDDFRLQNWREMELNEYLYANGEVVKLWHYPRGPDSGFKVYPGFGKRHAYYHTTALSHSLGEPAYIVRAHPAGSNPPPNGLPIYRLPYQNDDESYRRLGSDSRLMFTAPADGDYLIRVSDVRGFGGEKDFHYKLATKKPNPRFSVAIGGKDPKLSPKSGKLLTFTATREDGFNGPIRMDISGLPEGYSAPSPIIIGEGQSRAFGSIYAKEGAKPMKPEQAAAISVVASADIGGNKVTQKLGDLGKVELGGEAKLTVSAHPLGGASEITIRPGETVYATAKAVRNGFNARIEFGKDDSGKSLPHGLYVDNIGLNGLMIVEGQTEREFAITAAKWVEPGEHWFFLTTGADSGRTSAAVRVKVLGQGAE